MQIAPGSTAFTDVSLEAGERVFKGFDLSIYGRLVLSAEDLEYIRGYHLAHTSVYSRITRYLPEIRKGSILISFDFSDKWADDVMDCVTPQIDYAFMSGSGKSDEEIEARMKRLVELGAKLAVITKGSKGAVSYDGMEFYHQPIVPAQVVDTLGAGDAFITMFLVNYLISKDIPYSMRLAAEAAAVACSYYGAFGHGVPIK
jgi:fructoselysine 6-kinase